MPDLRHEKLIKAIGGGGDREVSSPSSEGLPSPLGPRWQESHQEGAELEVSTRKTQHVRQADHSALPPPAQDLGQTPEGPAPQFLHLYNDNTITWMECVLCVKKILIGVPGMLMTFAESHSLWSLRSLSLKWAQELQ